MWGGAGLCGRSHQWCCGWRSRWRLCCGVLIQRTLWWRTRKTSKESIQKSDTHTCACTHTYVDFYFSNEYTRRKQRYQSAPKNIHRHVLLSEIKEAVSTLPLVRSKPRNMNSLNIQVVFSNCFFFCLSFNWMDTSEVEKATFSLEYIFFSFYLSDWSSISELVQSLTLKSTDDFLIIIFKRKEICSSTRISTVRHSYQVHLMWPFATLGKDWSHHLRVGNYRERKKMFKFCRRWPVSLWWALIRFLRLIL